MILVESFEGEVGLAGDLNVGHHLVLVPIQTGEHLRVATVVLKVTFANLEEDIENQKKIDDVKFCALLLSRKYFTTENVLSLSQTTLCGQQNFLQSDGTYSNEPEVLYHSKFYAINNRNMTLSSAWSKDLCLDPPFLHYQTLYKMEAIKGNAQQSTNSLSNILFSKQE